MNSAGNIKTKNISIKKLKIADIIVHIKSNFYHEQVTEKKAEESSFWRLNNFIYKGNKKPNISIKVTVTDKLPSLGKARLLFVDRKSEALNWQVFIKDKNYIFIYKNQHRKQLILINKTFNKAEAFLLPIAEHVPTVINGIESMKVQKKYEWNVLEIVYDFLKVLFINYLAFKNEGVIVHGCGIKYMNREGMIFSGNSGSGKTTLAKIWYDYPQAKILNDDRIILKKNNNNFFIYSTPWHGMFNDYLQSEVKSVKLKSIFFIYHESKNICKNILPYKVFKIFYSNLFSLFWNKISIRNAMSISMDLSKNIPGYSLGFKKDKTIINFIKTLK